MISDIVREMAFEHYGSVDVNLLTADIIKLSNDLMKSDRIIPHQITKAINLNNRAIAVLVKYDSFDGEESKFRFTKLYCKSDLLTEELQQLLSEINKIV